jgi:hypothetical protein
MKLALAVGGIGALLLACTGPAGPPRHRGYFPLVTSRSIPAFGEIGTQPRAFSRECFGAGVFLGASDSALRDAVDKAIAQRPDGNALLYARVNDRGRCLEVEGWPVRHDP